MSEQKLAEWTVMVFLAGDNNLATAGDRDLEEMRRVGSTTEVNVVAEFDNHGDHGTQRYYIQKDGVDETMVELGETDSGNPAILVDFVKWSREKYPAKRYVLVLWNHGSGWTPSEVDQIAQKVGSSDYNAREAGERSASPLGRVFFRTTMEKILALPSAMERAICSDDGSGHSLDTIELGNVLNEVTSILDQKLDILGMDACLMSNIEVAYQARAYARFLVASEENEPNNGWAYDRFLERVTQNPTAESAEIATHLVNDYIAFYAKHLPGKTVTQSALDLGRFQEIFPALDRLSTTLVQHMLEAKFWIWEAKNKTKANFYTMSLWDIGEFCEQLAQMTIPADVQQAAQAVVTVLENEQERFVLAEAHRGDKVARCRGVTIYHPPKHGGISRFYADVDFAKRSNWHSLLKAYHSA